MMKKSITASWITFCLVFVGCTQPTARTPIPATRAEPAAWTAASTAATDALLRFVQKFNSMPADLQKQEYANISNQRRTEFSRMQLALIHGLPGNRFRDNARAQALIEEHLKAPDSRDDGLRNLASILKVQLGELQKSELTTATLSQRLKDEQKKSDTLQRKLDELLAVEKAMSDRHQKRPK